MWGGVYPILDGVPQCGRVCPTLGRCVPSVGECSLMWGGVSHSGSGAPVWECVPQCGRVCPCMCVCEVSVSLSHVLMADTQVHLCVHLIAGRFSHVVKAYLAKHPEISYY